MATAARTAPSASTSASTTKPATPAFPWREVLPWWLGIMFGFAGWVGLHWGAYATFYTTR